MICLPFIESYFARSRRPDFNSRGNLHKDTMLLEIVIETLSSRLRTPPNPAAAVEEAGVRASEEAGAAKEAGELAGVAAGLVIIKLAA